MERLRRASVELRDPQPSGRPSSPLLPAPCNALWLSRLRGRLPLFVRGRGQPLPPRPSSGARCAVRGSATARRPVAFSRDSFRNHAGGEAAPRQLRMSSLVIPRSMVREHTDPLFLRLCGACPELGAVASPARGRRRGATFRLPGPDDPLSVSHLRTRRAAVGIPVRACVRDRRILTCTGPAWPQYRPTSQLLGSHARLSTGYPRGRIALTNRLTAGCPPSLLAGCVRYSAR